MIFEASQRTPLVELTSTSCLIRGECYPENISEWSDPVLQELENCLSGDEQEFKVEIELYYFNSSSAKFLFDFFEFLEESASGGKAISVDWRYRAEDDTMQEAGEDFEEDMTACSYKLVVVESEEED
ncbi:MAG: DUF1987 domain-containing protein [Halieaceae bacterium]|jgi:hypothetical protein